MKITFKKLLYLIALVCFSFCAKAQQYAVPDTIRYSIGLDGEFPSGNLTNSYSYGLGISAQIDVPLSPKWYFTGNIGFESFFPDGYSGNNPEAIQGLKVSNFDVAPIKVGIKYFLIRTFYLQAEAGEAVLVDKSSVYGLHSFAPVFAPQLGLLFKLHHKNYIDAGFRYEWLQSFYGDGQYNKYFALRIAYGIN